MDPTRSMNITVNWRRSAATLALELVAGCCRVRGPALAPALRIWHWGGVDLAGSDQKRAAFATETWRQDALAGPQLGQTRRSCCRIPRRSFSPSGFSNPQLCTAHAASLLLRALQDKETARALTTQAAIFCCVLIFSTPSTYCAPAYTAGSNSAPLSRRKVDSATCNIFQINAVAFSTFLKRLAAVVRSRTVAKGDSTTFVVRKVRPVLTGKLVEGHEPFPIIGQPLHCFGCQLPIASGELLLGAPHRPPASRHRAWHTAGCAPRLGVSSASRQGHW